MSQLIQHFGASKRRRPVPEFWLKLENMKSLSQRRSSVAGKPTRGADVPLGEFGDHVKTGGTI
jgi:hypothetical protein